MKPSDSVGHCAAGSSSPVREPTTRWRELRRPSIGPECAGRVLVVDDVEANRTLLASFLKRDEDVAALERGGFLHDIGKVGVPDAVLLKRGRLTKDEYELMKQHAIIGDRLCGELRSLRNVRPIVRHHHERLAGSGYPDGLSGDAIPFLAQIIAVVDVFDALTTERPYRTAISAGAAHAALRREVRRGWHRSDLVEAFAALGRQNRIAIPGSTPGGARQHD